MSPAEMEKVNDDYKGILVCESSGTDTHMWSGPTCVRFLDHLTVEIRKQRQKLGKDHSARVMVIADKCTSHLSRTFLDMRRTWAKEQNCLILGLDPEADVQIPGGWSLSCSPNDGWHGHFHLLRMAFMRSSLGRDAQTQVAGKSSSNNSLLRYSFQGQ